MKTHFTEADFNLSHIQDQTVAVIGYGIQGRNQAQNLRDSGIDVLVHNRNDEFAKQAIDDGFRVYPIDQAVSKSDIILLLIPDGAQAKVYKEGIEPYIREGSMLVTAHGYSITFGGLKPKDGIDVTLLAPRFPGHIVRKNYLNGIGTLAFFDSYKDVTGSGEKRGLALAKGIGLTNLLHVGLEEETHADLFIENFLIPRLRGTIESCYNILTTNGISPEVAALEAYQSGEILGLLTDGINLGLYESFHSRTSPTCQFGVSEGHDKVNSNVMDDGQSIYEEIINGDFARKLAIEEKAGYPQKNKFNMQNLKSDFAQTLKNLKD